MKSKSIFTGCNVVSYVFLLICSFVINAATAFTVAGVEPLIMPAPYAFLIWGIIYLLIGIWIIKYGFKSTSADEAYMKVSRFLPLSLVCSGGSLIVGQPWAILCIGGALLTTACAYISCRHANPKPNFLKIPISIYLGWLSVAIIVEVATLLKINGMENLFGIPEIFWAIVSLIFVGFLAIAFTSTQQDYVYPLVVIWAFVAIAIHHLNVTAIFVTACGGILLIAFMMDRIKRISQK